MPWLSIAILWRSCFCFHFSESAVRVFCDTLSADFKTFKTDDFFCKVRSSIVSGHMSGAPSCAGGRHKWILIHWHGRYLRYPPSLLIIVKNAAIGIGTYRRVSRCIILATVWSSASQMKGGKQTPKLNIISISKRWECTLPQLNAEVWRRTVC